jgi:hypothetical protein
MIVNLISETERGRAAARILNDLDAAETVLNDIDPGRLSPADADRAERLRAQITSQRTRILNRYGWPGTSTQDSPTATSEGG